MESAFKSIIDHICRNWTALTLALQFSERQFNTVEKRAFLTNSIADFCLQNSNICKEDIEDFLGDLMDDEFDTICEDESTHDIAHILSQFINLMQEGNTARFEEEYNKLISVHVQPATSKELSSTDVSNNVQGAESIEVDESMDNDEVEDEGWTTIRSRRKH